VEQFYKRYYEYLEKRNYSPEIINEKIWVKNRMVLQPYGPAYYDYRLDNEKIKELMRSRKYGLITYTDGFEGEKNNKWYAVLCRNFISVDELKNSRLRYEINRGLKNIKCKIVSAKYIADHGYNSLRNASLKYNKTFRMTEKDFSNNIMDSDGYEDIIQYWGVFYNDKLSGFAVNHLYGNIEVNYSSIKIDPAYLSFYPAYSLIYSMNAHYLNDLKYQYVFDGFKTILHKTSIQDFLIKKFNFEKAYTNKYIHFLPFIRRGLRAASPLKIFFSKFNPTLKALYELYDISG
jgi:hypothetical protein